MRPIIGITSAFGPDPDGRVVREQSCLRAAYSDAILAAGGAVLTSYARARAENIGVSSTVGFWERPERTFMLMMGGLFLRMPSVLWELAVFANITAAHRLVHVWRRVERPSWRPPSIPVVTDILFWEYPRYCWQYDVYVGLGILVPLLLPIQ